MLRKTHPFLSAPIAALTLAVLATAMPLTTGAAEAREFKRIRDVNVSCTNALRCDLFITNPRVTLFTVGFRRAAAFEAPISLYLTLREPLTPGSEVRFVVDGIEALTVPAAGFSYRAAISEYSYSDQDAVRALFAAGKAGDRLQVTYRTRTGQSTAQFSLSGVVAGAIFMDEVQGRVGRDDALAAFGAAPQRPGEAARDVVVFDEVPERLRIYYEGEGAPCAEFDGGLPASLDGFELPLSDGSSVIGMRCGTGGAYNLPYAFWLNHAEGTERLALPVMTEQGPSADTLAWNAYWDAATGELVAFNKGRGLGDCGVMTSWTFSEDQMRFVLKEMRVKDECDGVFDDSFASWPQLWPPADDKS